VANQQTDQQKIAAMGREITMEAITASQELYLSRHEKEPYQGVTVDRDIAYGPHERNRLDIFRPEQAPAAPLPVFIFVHGGGFVRGDKHTPGTPYNDNVPLWAMRNGMVGVNITYRLAPEFTCPSGAEDVAAAVAWVRSNIADYGGDRERIYLCGTSAGAVHVGDYVAFEGIGDPERDIRGALLLSCMFDPVTGVKNEMLLSYFGDDPTRYPSQSCLPGLIETKVPLFVTLGEYEPFDFENQALIFIQKYMEKHGRWPNFRRLSGQNHLTTTMHLNAVETELGREMLRFIAEH